MVKFSAEHAYAVLGMEPPDQIKLSITTGVMARIANALGGVGKRLGKARGTAFWNAGENLAERQGALMPKVLGAGQRAARQGERLAGWASESGLRSAALGAGGIGVAGLGTAGAVDMLHRGPRERQRRELGV